MNTKNLHFTPIIKIMGNACNNRCNYCFYNNLDQTSYKRMDFELLKSFMSQHVKLIHGNLSFIWHGGEPTLAGLDFFNEIVRLQKLIIPPNRLVSNSIQTNGTLITNEWATFLKENNFKVGVSLDGTRESHNRFRVNHSGHGTFDKTIRGINILRKHGLRLSIIQTVTQENVYQPENDFKFFVNKMSLKSFGINPYFDSSKLNTSMHNQSLSNNSLTQIMMKYIDLWLEQDDSELRVREIDAFLAGLYEKHACNCSFNGSCNTFYTVNYDGSIYPCDRLSSDDKFYFGTLTEQTLKEILYAEKWQNFILNTKKLPNDCISCNWKNSCNNGCTAHRIDSINGKYFFCKSRKEVFDYLCAKIS